VPEGRKKATEHVSFGGEATPNTLADYSDDHVAASKIA
jgi:hypothetical protein